MVVDKFLRPYSCIGGLGGVITLDYHDLISKKSQVRLIHIKHDIFLKVDLDSLVVPFDIHFVNLQLATYLANCYAVHWIGQQ